MFPVIDRWLINRTRGRLKVALGQPIPSLGTRGANHNIRAHLDAVSAQVEGQHVAVRPRVVEEPERSELWRRVNDNYSGYEEYAQRAGTRIIPLAQQPRLMSLGKVAVPRGPARACASRRL